MTDITSGMKDVASSFAVLTQAGRAEWVGVRESAL